MWYTIHIKLYKCVYSCRDCGQQTGTETSTQLLPSNTRPALYYREEMCRLCSVDKYRLGNNQDHQGHKMGHQHSQVKGVLFPKVHSVINGLKFRHLR